MLSLRWRCPVATENNGAVLSSEKFTHNNRPVSTDTVMESEKKNWSRILDMCLTPRQTGRVTAGRKRTYNLTCTQLQVNIAHYPGNEMPSINMLHARRMIQLLGCERAIIMHIRRIWIIFWCIYKYIMCIEGAGFIEYLYMLFVETALSVDLLVSFDKI